MLDKSQDKFKMTQEQIDNLKEGVKNLKPKAKKSFRQVIFELYPIINSAMEEKQLTRQDIYEQLLNEDIKKNISLATFMSYYHLAQKEWTEKKKKEAKIEAASKKENSQQNCKSDNAADVNSNSNQDASVTQELQLTNNKDNDKQAKPLSDIQDRMQNTKKYADG